MLEYSDGTKIISADKPSADFFKACKAVTLIKDRQQCPVEAFLIDLGITVYSLTVEPDNNSGAEELFVSPDSDRVVAVGGWLATEQGKLAAARAMVPLTIIPLGFTSCCFVSYGFMPDSVSLFMPAASHEVIICQDYLRAQSREELAAGLGILSAFFISMLDSAFADMLFEREARAVKTLEYLCDASQRASKLSVPTVEVQNLLGVMLTECGRYCASLDCDNTVIRGAQLLSLKSKEKRPYVDYCFALAYTIFALYDRYTPSIGLLLPPDRAQNIDNLSAFFNGLEYHPIPVPVKDLSRRNFITADCLAMLKTALQHFPDLAVCYRRLCGSAGFGLREKYSAVELLSVLPPMAELCEDWSLLKQIYTNGELVCIS